MKENITRIVTGRSCDFSTGKVIVFHEALLFDRSLLLKHPIVIY